ncbi:small subunit processome component 20 homolog [Arabidopsis lyrata subsp. lyrata]|uniref:small subunit processome component 20 homolog n=1 Tax=Arabidopsis lyrata subsp. lyrata TaxID=81972 RepID=UPI000A29D73A|nr:small subunit processome component 20 homolog [Arabidopsis lyrata subsp. lyrata]|eukprot:XP_020868571.1 small subunit processome component 20 homolog [Arabidopsis lyrata subsp. lyrata]
MATPADSRAVKSLNNSSKGKKRYVFKKFSERINDIDIKKKVFRSLDKVKAEPCQGSTFFKDCLVELRELNTASDFILFYEEMLPFVQNLELILLQKEFIFSKLVSGLHMKARLSLDAFLRLIAALSRDILEDFIPFLPRIVNSLVMLLENGGQKDPDDIEQIFLSWSFIMRDLQKFLIRDIEGILRDTLALRYYPQDYISDKMSDTMSSLLTSAQDNQLKKGIKRILSEVADPLKKAGGVALLYSVMRGTSVSLHSKARKVLRFLLKDSTLSFCDNFPQGSDSTVEAVSSTLQRICEDFKAEELSVMWNCLYKETEESIANKQSAHLSRLLTVLTSAVRAEKGLKVYDSPYLVGLVSQIVSTFMDSSATVVEGDNFSAVLDKVLGLMLCTIDSPSAVSEMESIASQWAPIFSLKSSSLLSFLRELLKKEQLIVKAFTSNILSSINNMILGSSEDVLPLLISLCEKQQASPDRVTIIGESFESKFERIHEYLEENIKKIQTKIENTGLAQIDEAELAAVWGAVNCFPYFKVDSSLLICFKNTLRQHLAASDVNTSSAPVLMWQSLLGAALGSCLKFCHNGRLIHSDLEEALSLAKCYKSCAQVLSPVADYLDFVYRPLIANDDSCKACPDLQANKAQETFDVFSENLRHSNKDVRLQTIRILCHFETLSPNPSLEENPPKKKQKTEVIPTSSPKRNVLQLLLTVEKSPHTVSTETKLISLITRIQEDLSTCRIHEAYVPVVFNGMIGLFYSRYSKICVAASKCLAVLMKKHTAMVWNDFVCYLGQCQQKFVAIHNHPECGKYSISEKYTDLMEQFFIFLYPPSDSTSTAEVISMLLQTLQKVPTVAQLRVSEILPLLLEFFGYNSENSERVGLFKGGVCKGEEWKQLLIQWMILLKLMKYTGSSRTSLFVNDVLQDRFLDDNDANIQTNVLECLLEWNDDLRPHCLHLLNLIKPDKLSDELTTWNLSKDIEEASRPHLVSLVIRVLMPKVRNLKNSASRKRTSIPHRKAILRFFITQMDVNELSLFFALLIKPLNIIPEEAMDLFSSSGKSSVGCFQKLNFLKYLTVDTISTLSRKQKSGFLSVILQILEVFDEPHVRPFLDFLMGCVVRLLAGTSLKQFKKLRSLCLKIIAYALKKFGDCNLGSEFWDLFFSAVNPLIKSFKQEGSSSERPSSLFKCIFSMSKSCNLVTFLCREEFLISDIFSILTVTTASKDIKSYALKFIENLLRLDNELDEDEHMIKGFLDPYIEALISSLHSLFFGDILKRKSVKYHGNREIMILKLLSKHIRDGSHVTKYLDVLLSFLDKSVKDSDIHREALLAIQDISLNLGTESTSRIVKILSPLLIDAENEVRLCICNLLESLAKVDPSLVHVAKCVRDMNANSPMEVDGLDYEKIIDAYGKIDADFFNKSSEQHVMIILSQSIYNISSEELMLKDSARNLLCSFIEFSASILCLEASAHSDMIKEVTKSDGSWTGDRVLWIINKFILKHIGDTLNRGISIGKGEILLIRKMVATLPDAGNLSAFRPLCSEDDEVDFFKNIFSIQAHRRARAVKRFTKVVKDSSLPEGVLRRLLVSVFFNMLLDGQDEKGKNVQDACKEALASVSGHMSWKSYYALLNRCFHEMKEHTKKRKILLQLSGLILNNFHFLKDGYTHEAAEIRSCVEKILLPKIQMLIDSDSVNVDSYVAAVKVLNLLPKEIRDPQLGSIVPKICSYLKDGLASTRDVARKALAACVEELGLEYLQFVIKDLRAILKRGSEVHVLGYTVNFILSKCLSNPNPTCGKLDHCLGDLLAVVETDILEDVYEQKEELKTAFKKKKETVKRKSPETLKMIAENVTFRSSHVLKLLSPVTAQLQRPLTPKLISKLKEMLKCIAAGIEGNPSVDQRDLFCFIYERVVDGINNRNGLGDEAWKKKSRDLQVKAGAKSCPHLITVFALDLLHNRLKQIDLNNANEGLVSMLDPFVKLLAGCLSSKYEDVVSLSVRCFTPLSKLQLRSFKSEADKVKTALLTIIAQSATSSSSPLVLSCLKLFTVLLESGKFTLSSWELKMLLQLSMFVDLESDSSEDSSVTSLSLIKAILGRKLAVPNVHDIAGQVLGLMIKTHSDHTRKHCKKLHLEILVHYTPSEKCLQRHVNILLKHLSYEKLTGRLAVLDMLEDLINNFSKPYPGKQSFLDQQSQNFFLQLARRLATDDDKKVLSKICHVIKLLIGRISKDQVDYSLEHCLVWYKHENSRAIAAQVLGLFIEAMQEIFRKHICNVLQEAKMILESTVLLQDTVEEGSIPFWKESYHSLVMIEKMLQQFPDLTFGKDFEDIWKMVFKLMLHRHQWLRTISCRLLNYYFKESGTSQKLVASSLLGKPSSLFRVAVSLCVQLEDQRSTCIKDITENIVFALSGLHSMIGQSDDEFCSSLDDDEQVLFLNAFEELDSGKGRSNFLALTSGKRSENDARNVLIGSLLKRMGKLALDMDSLQMGIVFNVYKAFASQLNQEDCLLYAFRILLPLYKVCQGFTGKVIPDELKQLAEEVRDSIRDKSLGSQMFVQVYSEIKKSLEAKREKRKREDKLMAVINPERNAKRKLKLAAKNKANKKRRIMSNKMDRRARS